MAASHIPLLGFEPLNHAPLQKLPSEADVIRLIWGHVNSNFRGFQGISSICCRIKDRQGICLSKDQESCGGQNVACLLYKVKERWIEAGFPITERDDHIILKITALKKKFDMNKKKFDRKTANEEEKLACKQKFINTTFSLVPVDWKHRIMADSFLTSATNRERVRVLQDYVGDEETLPTRFLLPSPYTFTIHEAL